jgi:hypothetical protein
MQTKKRYIILNKYKEQGNWAVWNATIYRNSHYHLGLYEAFILPGG